MKSNTFFIKLISSMFLLQLTFSQKLKAQNDSIQEPIPCGTWFIIEKMNKENQKNIDDFIVASQKSMLFENGIWIHIGKQNTDEAILKKGLNKKDWHWKYIRIQKSIDSGNYRYILFSNTKGEKINMKYIALYDKIKFNFRVYDAFYYKNYQNPKLIGKFKLKSAFGYEVEKKIIMQPAIEDDNPENKWGSFVEIHDDYSFIANEKTFCGMGCVETRKGYYYIGKNGHIHFYFNEFLYDGIACGEQKKKKPFTLSYTFSENEVGNIELMQVNYK